MIIKDEQGRPVENSARLAITREAGELVFQPSAGARRYHAYYLPYTGTTRAPYPQITYCPPEDLVSQFKARQGEKKPEDYAETETDRRAGLMVSPRWRVMRRLRSSWSHRTWRWRKQWNTLDEE